LVTAHAFVRVCDACGAHHDYADPVWRCACGGVLSLRDVVPARPAGSGTGVWRYASSLPPVPDMHRVSLGEGQTPLIRVGALPGDVRAKLEFLSPTGAFKDRGNAVAVARLKHIGVSHVLEDSSGNAGASLAAYCAAAGVHCTVYVPASTPAAKLVQMRVAGANVVTVPGPRAAAAVAALAAAADMYYANPAWDPFFFEGTKTAAFELVEQLDGRAPARVLLPVGQGTMLLGLAKGFRELLGTGRIQRVPRLIAVQSDACAPLWEVFHRRLSALPAVSAPVRMLADGIATASPLRWAAIIAEVRASGGEILRVPEAAIPGAVLRLGKHGLFVEPTSATVWAAAEHLLARDRDLDGTTVLVLSGAGLKATTVVDAWLAPRDDAPRS